MSFDLLAEFDSFYKKPQEKSIPTSSALDDLSSLGGAIPTGSLGGQSLQEGGGGFQRWPSLSVKPAGGTLGNTASILSATQPRTQSVQNNDIWDAFRSIETAPQMSSMSTPVYGGGLSVVDAVENSRKHHPEVSGLHSYTPSASKPSLSTHQTNRIVQNPTTELRSSEVLFDADEVDSPNDDDDDFGDFESVTPEPNVLSPAHNFVDTKFGSAIMDSRFEKRPTDLLSISNLSNGSLPYPTAPISPSFQERNPFSEMGLLTEQTPAVKLNDQPSSVSPVTAWPTFEPNISKSDPYMDSPTTSQPSKESRKGFVDLPPKPSVHSANITRASIEDEAWGWDSVDHVANVPPAQVTIPPPSNIPPPSLLLTLFLPIFDSAQTLLFKPVASQQFSLKNRIIADSSTLEFLRGYLLIATVAARIIAGRKLRWKRDTLLSQAMKIGPSVAGGKGGMKLKGVDKAETMREDREAADVVRAWKEQVGKLKSAIAVANASIHDASSHLAIPDVSETAHIITHRGGLTAPKACVVCGLKREERINKVDIEVEDSFGEWWVEHWGHKACKNFWLQHERDLKQRF